MSQAKEAISKRPSGRTRRTPISQRNKLTVQGKDPNYEYRWVNDVDGRIQGFKDADWELVLTDEINVGDRRLESASVIGSNVSIPVGNQTTGYLMRIKKEWYAEDQAAKQELVDKLEQDMHRDVRNAGDYGSGVTNDSSFGRHK